jgi:hypothetical protein
MSVHDTSFAALKITDAEQARLRDILARACGKPFGRFIPIEMGDCPECLFLPHNVQVTRIAENAARDVQIMFLSVDGNEKRPDGVDWFVIWSADESGLSRRNPEGLTHSFRDPASNSGDILSDLDIIRYVRHSLTTSGADVFYWHRAPGGINVWTNSVMVEQQNGFTRVISPELGAPYGQDDDQMSGGPMATCQMN